MKIDVRKLREAGYHVTIDDTGMEIYPEEYQDVRALIELLRDEYQLDQMYAEGLVERLHVYQIMSIISK